jgi:FdhE protein
MISAWDRRITRAEKLAYTHPAAAELLKFYAEIARFQRSIDDALSSVKRSDIDTTLLIPHFAPLLSLVRRIGPPPLAETAARLAGRNEALQDLLIRWRDSDSAADPNAETNVFFARTLLQPYTECLARRSDVAAGNSPSLCPFCGEKPQAGVLREEGDGAKRSLICSLCATEWDFRRILCPACGEEAVDKLPVYTASEFDYVRVEACETCHTYIKSVDLTKNGLAVPVVDELATIPLNVWAEEKGYRKLQLNLLGM